jgi:hypothetical protein
VPRYRYLLSRGRGRGRVPAHPRSKSVGELLDVAARRLARARARVSRGC